MKKVLLTTVMSLMMCMGVFAQDYLNAPKAGEKVIGTVTASGILYQNTSITNLQVYKILLDKAKSDFSDRVIDIRDIKFEQYITSNYNYSSGNEDHQYNASGKVVDLHDPEAQMNGGLSQALNKALRNVREGSRLAIDQVTVSGSMDREALKDQLLDVLLDKGYKVVAKEYLERLYEEQQAQQSGIYNEKTTVQENNFSAVGYYINVKVTETSLRVQVVNVSTGEYEGNATVNFKNQR